MFKQRNLRAPLIATLGLLGMFAVPAAAQAHHVDSDAKCVLVNNAPTLQLDADFIGFSSPGSQNVTGTVTRRQRRQVQRRCAGRLERQRRHAGATRSRPAPARSTR